ncbi:hypothetical protein BACCIP111895_03971 [Neobacillus rhizosphaerae]|uniref:DUF3995 domain-containing protein n=1 Tax=Neobacillus rhizosphaerae TaxID=2880965 RepID=A0ABM9EVP7_9BACI|nr:hypothetical protein [Neobacillus rhizosphaerae]CAH2716783.1 hypothetical protein BACCIP111895_03971 [Neobacillus rhizosphaerae]
MNSTSPLMKMDTEKGLKHWPSWIGYMAVVWSLLYGAMHLYWLIRGEGYPFKNDSLGLFSALVTYLPARVGGIVFVILGLLGIGIGIAMQKSWGRMLPRWLFLTYAWVFAAALLLFIPDISLIAAMAYAFMFKFAFNWQMFNQIVCIIGALLWISTAVVYYRRTRNACEYCGRTEHDKPSLLLRWGRWITIIAALAPLPYALTRFAWALNIPLGVDAQFLRDFSNINPMANITEWVFGSVCIGGGILTLGLIQKWGEVFPRWFPFIGGKRVPILLAVIPASIVAIAVTAAGLVFTFSFFAVTFHLMPADDILLSSIGGAIGPMLFWVPWGITLGLATIAYYYRRRGRCLHCGNDHNA